MTQGELAGLLQKNVELKQTLSGLKGQGATVGVDAAKAAPIDHAAKAFDLNQSIERKKMQMKRLEQAERRGLKLLQPMSRHCGTCSCSKPH